MIKYGPLNTGIATGLSLGISLLSACAYADGSSVWLAPVHQYSTDSVPTIKDDDGRIQYIVDLSEGAPDAYSTTLSPAAFGRFKERDQPQMQNLALAMEEQYGFVSDSLITWADNSIIAFLTSEQVAALQRNPSVVRISEVLPVSFDVTLPPWADSTQAGSGGTETISWGRTAVKGKTSNGTARVYVIDGGVGYHSDLGNVTRVNASCGPNNTPCANTSLYPVVACYAHATHVAGIIAATKGNFGVAGVDAGVPIVSLGIDHGVQTYGSGGGQITKSCADDSYSNTGTVANALDYVVWDIALSYHKVAVVNLSISAQHGAPINDFAYNNTLYQKMLNVATPHLLGGGTWYTGAFIAQSAGNEEVDACTKAFAYSNLLADVDDGIMVVGGVNKNGLPVDGTAGAPGFVNGGYAADEIGSNWGGCVDVWAPSKAILSTWGGGKFDALNPTTWQDGTVTYNSYVSLSGTSMAAPHISGVAAYLLEHNTVASGPALETLVRTYYYTYGPAYHGYPINMVQLP